MPKLTDLPNIGEKRAAVLHAHGYTSVAKLARVSATELQELLGSQITRNDAQVTLSAANRYRKRRFSLTALVSAGAILIGVLANTGIIMPFFLNMFQKHFRSGTSLYLLDRSCFELSNCLVSSRPSSETKTARIHFFTASPHSDRTVPICLALRFGISFEHQPVEKRKLIVSINYGDAIEAKQKYQNSSYPSYKGDFETCSIHEPFYFPDHPNFKVSRELYRTTTQTTVEYSFIEYIPNQIIHFHVPVRLDPNSFIFTSSSSQNPYLEESSADLNMNALGPVTQFNATPISVTFRIDDFSTRSILDVELFNHVVSTPDEIGLRSGILHGHKNARTDEQYVQTLIGDIAAVNVDQNYIENFQRGGFEAAKIDAQKGYFILDEKSLRRALSQTETAHLYGTSILLREPVLSEFERSCIDGLLLEAGHLGSSISFPSGVFNHAHNSFRTYGIFERQFPQLIANMNKMDCFK